MFLCIHITCHACVVISDFPNSSNTGTPSKGCNGSSCLSEAHDVSLHKSALTQNGSNRFQIFSDYIVWCIDNDLAASRMNWFICCVANSQVGWMQSNRDHRSKVMLPAQLLYLFDSSSSLRYLTVNCHSLCAKLLWFQGGHAVHELLAIPRDASRSCSLRKLRHLSSETVHRVQVHDVLIYGNSPEEGIQKLPPLFLILKENEREMQMVSHLELFLVATGPVSKVNTIVFIMCYTGISKNCGCNDPIQGFSRGHDLLYFFNLCL